MMIPEQIAASLPEVGGVPEDIGCSGATVIDYGDRFLKVQEECNVSANEFRMLRWLQGRVPVPRLIAAAEADGRRWLVSSRMPGAYLCTEAAVRAGAAEAVGGGRRRLSDLAHAG